MKTDDVLFTGTRDGLLVRLSDREPFERVKVRLHEKLLANPSFFHASETPGVTVNVGDRILTTRQLLELEALFRQYLNMGTLQIVNASEAETISLHVQGTARRRRRSREQGQASQKGQEAAEHMSLVEQTVKVASVGMDSTIGEVNDSPLEQDDSKRLGTFHVSMPSMPSASPAPKKMSDAGQRVTSSQAERTGREERDTLLVRRTLRSGQGLRHSGNVVIMGDVNPGAEVIAGGDIIVLGSLRGVVHAGATGDEDAVVVAFRLQSTQLRIAGYISRAPDEESEGPAQPEVARVRDGGIVIEPYQSADMF